MKVDGSYIATCTPTAETDSAYGAYTDDGVSIGDGDDDDGDGDFAINFEEDGASIGDDISRDGDDNFVVNASGVYEVSYRVSTADAATGGSFQVEVGGDEVGPEVTFAIAGGTVSDTVMVEASAGDTIEVVGENSGADVELVDGGGASLTIELIAVEPPA